MRLGKDLMSVAARALRANMTSLGPLVLPASEQITFGANLALRKMAAHSKPLARAVPAAWLRPYTPKFTKAFEHMCIHTGELGAERAALTCTSSLAYISAITCRSAAVTLSPMLIPAQIF